MFHIDVMHELKILGSCPVCMQAKSVKTSHLFLLIKYINIMYTEYKTNRFQI